MDERDKESGAELPDQLLKAAISSYTHPGTVPGLEARVMARARENAFGGRAPLLAALMWALRGSFVAAAALLLVVFFSGLHQRRGEQLRTSAEVRQPKAAPIARPQRALVPRRLLVSTTPHHLREKHVRRAEEIASAPFKQVPPSPEERILLTLTPAQSEQLKDMRTATPTKIAPVEISAVTIPPLQDKPLKQ